MISVSELRNLLCELLAHQGDTGIRFRLTGQMWMHKFFRIISVTEKGVKVKAEGGTDVLTIDDLAGIMQLEMNRAFRQYQPFISYDISIFEEK